MMYAFTPFANAIGVVFMVDLLDFVFCWIFRF